MRTRSLLLLCLMMGVTTAIAGRSDTWRLSKSVPNEHAPDLHPIQYKTFSADNSTLRASFAAAGVNEADAVQILLPDPDGNMQAFLVRETPVMEPALAARYPDIQTYTGISTSNSRVTAKIELTPAGLHAFVLAGSRSYLIDPHSRQSPDDYIVYFKKDYERAPGLRLSCEVPPHPIAQQPAYGAFRKNARVNGTTRKTYRLALAADSEYCAAVAGPNPTKAEVLAKMITTLNRVNGVYERELSLTMMLVATEDTLIFINNSPYYNSSGSAMMAQNQGIVTARIGARNYDIGHVFSTGGGGIAELGCVCWDTAKAMGVTGRADPTGDAFDIDFVAHEMGHQFGADHTFNGSKGICFGNVAPWDAYEPGSGSTIMAYGGYCAEDDFQAHSDDYFHSKSLEEINTSISPPAKGAFASSSEPSPYLDVSVPAFAATHFIPFGTPFELTAPRSDNDSATYCWEERDLGDVEKSLAETRLKGPQFRSFPPTGNVTRVFPAPAMLVKGIFSYNAEKLPDTARTLQFGLTVRDTRGGWGRFNFPDDRATLQVIRTPRPFTVNAPLTDDTLAGGSLYEIRWDVAATNAPPISCAQVDIFLSTDSGYTFPVMLKGATPNDGSEIVRIPNLGTTAAARIKVKGRDNVFFSLNPAPFILRHSDASGARDVIVTPVPASDALHIYIPESMGETSIILVDAVGRTIWQGSGQGYIDLEAGGWARGIYVLRMTGSDGSSNQRKVVLR